MKHSVKKIASIFCVGTLSLAALGACGSDDGKSSGAGDGGEATTISILAPEYGNSGESKAEWEKIIAKFKEDHPDVEVQLQVEPWDDFDSKISARLQSDDAPDILNDNKFASYQDMLLPITDVMDQETLDSVEPALLANGLGADGTQWAIPDVASARELVYNTDILSGAGVEAPKSWADLENVCTAIKAKYPDVAPYGMPLGTEEAQVEASLWVWGAGGEWVDGENIVAKTPASEEGFAQMKKLIDMGCTQSDISQNRADIAKGFNNGKIAMFMGHSGLTNVTKTDFPDIHFDVAPVPSKDGKGVAYGVTDFIVAFDNGDDARKAATSELLKVFYSDEFYGNWVTPTGLLPITTSLIETGKAEADEVNAKYYDALSMVKFQPVGNPSWDILQGALQSSAAKIAEMEPAALLDEVQAQVDAQS